MKLWLLRLRRLIQTWFSPLKFFERGYLNLFLNLFGGLALAAAIWWASRFGTSAAIALALAGLLVLALAALWNKLPPQLLEIRFDPATVQEPAMVDQGVVIGQARWFHFEVHTEAKVRNCQGRLILLEEEDSAGNYKRVFAFKPPVSLTLDSAGQVRRRS